MAHGDLSRRRFLTAGGALAALGPTAAPFALQLAALGAAAATPPDYKALVCIFQYGGNDANNTVLATDPDSWGRYFAARNVGQDPIALMPVGSAPTPVGQVSPVTGRTVSAMRMPEAWGGVLPITPRTPNPVPAGTAVSGTRTFALHPAMALLTGHFNAGRLAVLANVGPLLQPLTKAQFQARSAPIPPNLFSHNDQQSTWQAGAVEGVRTGWGGRFGDLLASMNGQNSLFTAISTSGNAVFLAGQSVVQYQVTTNALPAVAVNGVVAKTLDGSSGGPAALAALIGDTSPAADIASDYASIVQRSLNSTATLNGAMALPAVQAIAAPPAYVNPTTGRTTSNPLATQLQTVARLIAAAPTLGVRRQVFFISVSGHDTHDGQNDYQPDNLAKLAQALDYFDQTLSTLGGVDMRPQVTSFTASDFSRSFTTNGDGTDHAWGSHHLIMGGAVRGGDMYGQYPTLGIDQGAFKNPDMAGTALVPTTSVDQYAATLGQWFGVQAGDLATVFPNLANFARPNLGFV